MAPDTCGGLPNTARKQPFPFLALPYMCHYSTVNTSQTGEAGFNGETF